MSNIFDISALVADNPQLSWVLEETEDSEVLSSITTSPTGVTVISRHISPDVAGGSRGSDEEEDEETVTPTMSPSMVERVDRAPKAGVTPESGKSSSSDSMMKILLQIPPSKVVADSPKERSSSSISSSLIASPGKSSSSDSMMNILLQIPPSKVVVDSPKERSSSSISSSLIASPELLDIALIGSPALSPDGITSPKRKSKRRSSQGSTSQSSSISELSNIVSTRRHVFPPDSITSPKRKSKRRSSQGSTSQSSSTSECDYTPRRHVETGLGDLEAKSALFLAKHRSPPKLQQAYIRQQQISTDPYAVGLLTMHEVLRDGNRLTMELQRDAEALDWWRMKKAVPCVCNVNRHPSWWTVDRIQEVHNYSFLLDCKGVKLDRGTMVAANTPETVVVYNVPMDHNNPVKVKAEQVLRFIDVEIGLGDQTCFDLFYYIQPSHRKMMLVVSHSRVVGLVVAEEVSSAHRILQRTPKYMELEEKPVPVRVGINRLWIHISMRRRHLATMLCRLIGCIYPSLHYGSTFYENETLNEEDYAFNNISDSMVMFARIFLKTLRPPLYCQLR